MRSECPSCGVALRERMCGLWICQACGHEWDDPQPTGWHRIETLDMETMALLWAPPERLWESRHNGESWYLPEMKVSTPKDWTWATHWMPLPSPPMESATSDPARVQSDAPAQVERLRDVNSSSLVLSSSSLRTLVEREIVQQESYARGDTPCADVWKDRPGPAGHAHTASVLRGILQADDLAALLSPVAVEETHENTATRTGDDGLSTSSRTASTEREGLRQ